MLFYNCLQACSLIYEFIGYIINAWWPWLLILNFNWILQLFIIYTYVGMYCYNNIYYMLLYVFLNFFCIGVYLSTLQLDLFTAFLWLLECSVIFVFLLLLFFLNIKGTSQVYSNNSSVLAIVCFILLYLSLVYIFQDQDTIININIFQNYLFDNFYEAIFNFLLNDLYGFSISYYNINFVEFIIVGFLLLLGSVVCVNLNQTNKSTTSQGYSDFVKTFKIFENLVSFIFLKKQNLVNQSNSKSNVKMYNKK